MQTSNLTEFSCAEVGAGKGPEAAPATLCGAPPKLRAVPEGLVFFFFVRALFLLATVGIPGRFSFCRV